MELTQNPPTPELINWGNTWYPTAEFTKHKVQCVHAKPVGRHRGDRSRNIHGKPSLKDGDEIEASLCGSNGRVAACTGKV